MLSCSCVNTWHALDFVAWMAFYSADGNYEVRYKSNVLIYSDGKIVWIPPAIYQSSCTIDVTYFPFDQQKCVMKFGSWTFTGDQVSLELQKKYVDLNDYWKSGTWDIVEVPAFLNIYRFVSLGFPLLFPTYNNHVFLDTAEPKMGSQQKPTSPFTLIFVERPSFIQLISSYQLYSFLFSASSYSICQPKQVSHFTFFIRLISLYMHCLPASTPLCLSFASSSREILESSSALKTRLPFISMMPFVLSY